jgi:hypothetical protein
MWTSVASLRSCPPIRARVVVVLFVAATAAACEDPQARLDEVLADARVCDEGDTCVLAGGTDCTCDQPVRVDAADAVNAAAAGISCCDLLGRCVAVDCAAFANVRCEAGQCVGN